MKEIFSTHPELIQESDLDRRIKIDDLKIDTLFLSKHLPLERYNGIINFFYVLIYPNATSEEVESVLVILAAIELKLVKFKMHLANTNIFRDISTGLTLRLQKYRSSQNFRF